MEIAVEREEENYLELRIQGEDHTLGNLIAGRLRSVKGVILATYYLPHPLKDELVIKIKTDGTISPREALNRAIEDVKVLGESFLDELEQV
ncbi:MULTISPECIES: DNA-directed RNA polymerase subunit L [Metallosphaera]|uniref:DNA-directed RNA polymerase subunit Rpo11 n=3 Tax=Metallosphaera TaxID=41980 RepID=RPO11_METS5|nr:MULTISPECIES: DNA-directed RNA polymerase subunit L [Metallosphaera]A4YHV0.1 RecName: Full=DNA-directed RNA polymerase subunit Rpo11; AltName: Full=DNA-directed RNA polymerase subunit L [Metallosphaera sedula DSM 5348]ABP96002.1 DNA-directed RNA polymerase, subunit L [Metallosphaera sedula DSM 5348]AIM27986.1 DNA-directed RNA polymerase, subunit L [Metallosphaera sedula]AKV74820.1 DNA-directed RNA polymerase subunit L [Metallosphaera sedula]AKV77056.1 DNA-directed RNA polymerase subunit L [